MVERKFVKIGSTRLAYRQYGQPEAPPLVLLHSLGEDATTWEHVAQALCTHRRTYVLDLRGHGESDQPGEYSINAMRSELAGFLDALSIEQTDLLGHSLGGILAYLLAEEHPDRVRRLMLEDARAPLPRTPVPINRPSGSLTYDWAAVLAIRSQFDNPDPAWWQHLNQITAPTLIVSGGPTSPVPLDELKRMENRIPNCHMVTIPAGHNIHANQPDKFLQTALHFLLSG